MRSIGVVADAPNAPKATLISIGILGVKGLGVEVGKSHSIC